MANINGSPRAFQAGGQVDIIVAATTYTLLNVEPGALAWTEVLPKRLEYNDRGPVQVPLELDDKPGTIDLSMRCGASYITGQVLALLKGRNSSGNTARTFGVVIRIYDFLGAATGTSLTWAEGNVWLREEPKWKPGGDSGFDLLDFMFNTKVSPTPAAF